MNDLIEIDRQKLEKINAFVGHSFDEQDKIVVRAFLDYFDTLRKNSGLDFSWEHAEEAQTTAISKKVKEKIQGKNLFIGIFTLKERVIKNHLLKKGNLFNSNQLMSDEKNYEWKTSDWVVQELGYCLGKDMSVIILMEKGLRAFSGLQADHEFIEFDRENPSQCFQRMLQQIGSINYSTSNDDAQIEENNVSIELLVDDAPKKENKQKDWKNPDNDWDYWDYWVALFFALKDKDKATEHKVYSAYISKNDDDISKIKNWEADLLLLKQTHLNESAIQPIKALIKSNPSIKDLHNKLAKAYANYDSYSLAFEESEKTLTASKDLIIDDLISTVNYLRKHSGDKAGANYLRKYLTKIPENLDDKFKFLQISAELHKTDFPNIYFAFCEAALALKPDDESLRFDLAFKYSELDLFKLSAFHYKILVETSPSENNWNNLGVAYSNLNIISKSIAAYIKSSDLEGTLAKSNLANKLLSVGFADQALELCKEAMKKDSFDKRITTSLESINEKLDADQKGVASIKEDTKLLREFSISFAKALISVTTNIKVGFYKYKDCDLKVSLSGNKFEAYGVYEREIRTEGLGLAVLYGTQSTDKKKIESHKISIIGEVQGDGIVAKLHKKSENQSLLNSEQTKDLSLYYSSLEQCFYVTEFGTGNNQNEVYKLTFISDIE